MPDQIRMKAKHGKQNNAQIVLLHLNVSPLSNSNPAFSEKLI